VSDERDSADAAGDGTEDSGTRGQTAVVTPQRPTGKRTRQRALTNGDDDATDTEVIAVEDGAGKNGSGTKTKTKQGKTVKKGTDGPSRNPILFVVTYLQQVIGELRKVIWPNRKQMVSYTTVVLLFLAFMVALIGGVDLGLAKLVLLVFG
jgi:preprotein translocase subunit SecE